MTGDNTQSAPLLSDNSSAYALNATIIYCNNQGAIALGKKSRIPRSKQTYRHPVALPARIDCGRLYYTKIRAYIRTDCRWINKAADKRKVLDISKSTWVRKSLRQHLTGHTRRLLFQRKASIQRRFGNRHGLAPVGVPTAPGPGGMWHQHPVSGYIWVFLCKKLSLTYFNA